MPFIFKTTKIPEVILIKPKVFGDNRGFFMETYKESNFVENGIEEKFVQDNHSRSIKGVLRGLHYQLAPFEQGKLVRCIQGKIYDVAVDIRKSSPNFAKWVGVYLSENNKNMLYIPAGFAHGFYTISEVAEIVYKATKEYSSECDRGIIWKDPLINIKWPSKEVILSNKDKNLPFLKDMEVFL